MILKMLWWLNRSSLLLVFLHYLLIYFSLIFLLIKLAAVYGHSIILETSRLCSSLPIFPQYCCLFILFIYFFCYRAKLVSVCGCCSILKTIRPMLAQLDIGQKILHLLVDLRKRYYHLGLKNYWIWYKHSSTSLHYCNFLKSKCSLSYCWICTGTKTCGDGLPWSFSKEYPGSFWWWWKLGSWKALLWLGHQHLCYCLTQSLCSTMSG